VSCDLRLWPRGGSRRAKDRRCLSEPIENLVGPESARAGCSDLFSVVNSSALMPPTCSTVRTCFW